VLARLCFAHFRIDHFSDAEKQLQKNYFNNEPLFVFSPSFTLLLLEFHGAKANLHYYYCFHASKGDLQCFKKGIVDHYRIVIIATFKQVDRKSQ